MRWLGAEVVLVPQAEGSRPGQVTGEDLALVDERARRLTHERRAFRADQFTRLANRLAHERHTGPELWAQTGGQIDAFCEFVGTGGTYAGVTAALKTRRPSIRCYVVEPAGAAVLAGRPVTDPQHHIQGGGYGMAELEMLRDIPVDGHLQVSDSDAIGVARRLAREEGIFAGVSSGGGLVAALRISAEVENAVIVHVVCDRGDRYLSTGVFPA
jgi:cysteine synthase A